MPMKQPHSKESYEKEIIATCPVKRKRVETQDEQILPWKDTIAEAAPHAMLPVRMDILKPQSELLFCTEQCVITYTTEFVGNSEESWKYFKQCFSQFIAVTDTKLMNNTGKVILLTLS